MESLDLFGFNQSNLCVESFVRSDSTYQKSTGTGMYIHRLRVLNREAAMDAPEIRLSHFSEARSS